VRNNIFALSAWHAAWRYAWRKEPSSVVERNIFHLTQGELFHDDAGRDDKRTRWDRNLYWRTDGRPATFYGDSFAEWQAKGLDVNGRVADPRFADPAGGDFSLPEDSPALELGFRPFDSGQAGLVGPDEWRKLPRQAVFPPTVLPPPPPPPRPPFEAHAQPGRLLSNPLRGLVEQVGRRRVRPVHRPDLPDGTTCGSPAGKEQQSAGGDGLRGGPSMTPAGGNRAIKPHAPCTPLAPDECLAKRNERPLEEGNVERRRPLQERAGLPGKFRGLQGEPATPRTSSPGTRCRRRGRIGRDGRA
jgi:hypothetical protein